MCEEKKTDEGRFDKNNCTLNEVHGDAAIKALNANYNEINYK